MRALGKITILIIVPFLTFGQKLTYIPDNNFEQELIHLGYDDVLDNWVLTESIDTITSLTVNWEWISDLTGIEDFISLIYLDCSGNDLAELNVSNNKKYISRIVNAGSICIGKYTPMAVTDYNSGSQHTLPTLGSAKFSSGLNVNDFFKKISYVNLSKKGVAKIGKFAIQMSDFEELKAHSKSIKSRIRSK